MNSNLLMNFVVDKEQKKINVERTFDAPVDLVWAAWTQSEILDEWWAPKPFRARTKYMNFTEGGYWLYAMVGPEGTEQWCRSDYQSISAKKSFSVRDNFCDDAGEVAENFPNSLWTNVFIEEGNSTNVQIEIRYEQLSDLEKIMEMGFKEGFSACVHNLDAYLSTRFKLWKDNKKSSSARVSTYLNFPGKTEEAFQFYKKVFNGEFTGVGLKRFGDIEMPKELPPMSEADKNLIIHAELTIMNGHILMATDSPESMGFKMEYGNNMHINIEPDSRKETERIFKELSEGGQVSMPLQDMFWGAYYASFTDRFGINWMLNYQEASA